MTRFAFSPPGGLRNAAALLVAALVLAACASETPPARCPEVAVLQEAGRLVQFDGAGRDLTDVDFEARIVDVALGCELDVDDGRRTVEAELQVLFEAEKGPANDTGQAGFTYFVGVADQNDNVLRRETFELTMALPGNQTRGQAVDVLAPRIALPEGETGQSYVLYIGFDLTRDQLEYNRRNSL